MSDKKWKILKTILLLGTVLAAIKLIFVDYTLDEEYQIVMAYRNLKGDRLFKQMWEPHQTSAFLCAGLMWLYMTVTGTTTGIVLFLRFVTLGIQVALAYAVYRTLIKSMDKDYAFLLGLLYFNISPKIIQIPDFSNMQLWFLTIPLLLMMKYYDDSQQQKDSWYLLIPVGISLSCEILTYPTCIILFPFFAIYILCKSEKKWRDCLILTGICALCGGVWLLGVFRHVSVEEFLQNVGNLLSFDPTHDVSGMTSAKRYNYIENIFLWGGWCAVIAAVSGLLCAILHLFFKKKGSMPDRKSWILIFATIAIIVAELVQMYYWAIRGIGYEYLQIHWLVLLIATAATWHMAAKRSRVFVWGILGTLIAYAGVMYISDLSMYYTLPHGALGLVLAGGAIAFAMEEAMGKKAKPWILLLIVSLCFCSMFGKAYTFRGKKAENTILTVGGIMKDGPAVGILADYMCAYIYNCNYEDYAEYVQPGDNVLIVANMIMSVGTTAYLFDGLDLNVSHFSIVDPTTYDEKLLTYWEQYPEKRPNVIVVDCWYGELKEDTESWIMQYIENDFGYTSVEDGSYVRFYRR